MTSLAVLPPAVFSHQKGDFFAKKPGVPLAVLPPAVFPHQKGDFLAKQNPCIGNNSLKSS